MMMPRLPDIVFIRFATFKH